jgi:hypothetical protein
MIDAKAKETKEFNDALASDDFVKNNRLVSQIIDRWYCDLKGMLKKHADCPVATIFLSGYDIFTYKGDDSSQDKIYAASLTSQLSGDTFFIRYGKVVKNKSTNQDDLEYTEDVDKIESFSDKLSFGGHDGEMISRNLFCMLIGGMSKDVLVKIRARDLYTSFDSDRCQVLTGNRGSIADLYRWNDRNQDVASMVDSAIADTISTLGNGSCVSRRYLQKYGCESKPFLYVTVANMAHDFSEAGSMSAASERYSNSSYRCYLYWPLVMFSEYNAYDTSSYTNDRENGIRESTKEVLTYYFGKDYLKRKDAKIISAASDVVAASKEKRASDIIRTSDVVMLCDEVNFINSNKDKSDSGGGFPFYDDTAYSHIYGLKFDKSGVIRKRKDKEKANVVASWLIEDGNPMTDVKGDQIEAQIVGSSFLKKTFDANGYIAIPTENVLDVPNETLSNYRDFIFVKKSSIDKIGLYIDVSVSSSSYDKSKEYQLILRFGKGYHIDVARFTVTSKNKLDHYGTEIEDFDLAKVRNTISCGGIIPTAGFDAVFVRAEIG